MDAINANLKFYRERAQLTQSDVAKRCGLSQSAVSMWETGDSLPRTDMLPRLAEIYGCAVDELLDCSSSPASAMA